MPRENVHWKILQSAVSTLPAGQLRNAIDRYPESVRIGSMAPDAPYYFRLGGSVFERTAERIHGGHGEDTLEPVRRMLLDLRDRHVEERPFYYAFIAGFLSHLATDIVYHPFVYAMTGNYYADNQGERVHAQTEHRLFETFLEHCLTSGSKPVHSDLWSAWRSLSKGDRMRLASFVADVIPPESPHAPEADDSSVVTRGHQTWAQALFHISFLQRLLTNYPLSAFVRLLDLIVFMPLAPKLHSMAVLFLPLRAAPEALTHPFAYVHPVTGEVFTASVETLKRGAIEKLAQWLSLLHEITEHSTYDPRAAFNGIVGESLNTGIVRGKNTDARHFNELGRWKTSRRTSDS